MILFVLIILSILYFIADRELVKGLSKLKKHQNKPIEIANNPTKKVSVLLCARNEEQNLPTILPYLFEQSYPDNQWELLIADDRSTDSTPQILAEIKSNSTINIKIIRIEITPEGVSPKKHALTELHKHVTGDIVLTTDADCLVPPEWISSMVHEFDKETAMVLGHSAYTKTTQINDNLWGIQSLDFLSHGIVAAGACALGAPINSNANNLAYLKSAFDEVDGYKNIETIASGDDDLLLHKLIQAHRNIKYCTNPDSFVETFPQDSYAGVWEQRKRWASKTIHYTPSTVIFLSAVFLYYSLILICIILGVFSNYLLFLGLTTLAWKSWCDWTVMKKGAALLNKEPLLKYFYQTALLHIPGIIGAVIFGTMGKFEWKKSPS